MYCPMQKFLVAGLSRSGMAAALLLLRHGAEVYAFDEGEREGLEKNFALIKEKGGKEVLSSELESVRAACDVLVLSPGVPIDHPLPVWFRKAGKRIMGEMELGALFLRSPSVAVTGTNGKTTVVGMIEAIFKEDGKNAVACGNVGNPLCNVVEELGYDDIAVIEVSSFQLESLSSLSSHICVELNLTPDHLNRHYNMENYRFLKEKLLKNGTESEFAVLNADDEEVSRFAEATKAKKVFFSCREKTDGAYLFEDDLFWQGEKIMSSADLSLDGEHNRANALAAIAVCKLFGASNGAIVRALSSFRGIRHRIEKVLEKDGVTYIDDSKATNVDATVKALDSVTGELVLLLGGKDKGYEYVDLFGKIKECGRVSHVFLYGENKLRLLSSALRAGYHSFTVCRDLGEATMLASRVADQGQSVLLSPASSSFDAFSGYEERGEYYANIVKMLYIEKNGEKEGYAIADGEEGKAEDGKGEE